ncbi:hypothetical protein L484_019832 [Morus notabilis]|uniref:Uncharacterized protein n=1 Tax=Morus notabilis TaxID=981085 RepID=W9RU14_9ROSA|nr:hypothetical protein L484_019832 [Morus notabilis]
MKYTDLVIEQYGKIWGYRPSAPKQSEVHTCKAGKVSTRSRQRQQLQVQVVAKSISQSGKIDGVGRKHGCK